MFEASFTQCLHFTFKCKLLCEMTDFLLPLPFTYLTGTVALKACVLSRI